MSVRFPIAASAEAALQAPLGRAERERPACEIAAAPVRFVRELVGPAFASREAAEAAYAGLVDAAGQGGVAPEDRFCELMEVAEPAARGGQAEPVFEAGRRWPRPKSLLKTSWRLSIGYWRVGEEPPAMDLPQARDARRRREGLDAAALKALASQPLQPVKPQQPLDIGLFEVRPPDAPHIIMPDE